jgi:hypothetical protein
MSSSTRASLLNLILLGMLALVNRSIITFFITFYLSAALENEDNVLRIVSRIILEVLLTS